MIKLIPKKSFIRKLSGGGTPEPTVDEIGSVLLGDYVWGQVKNNKQQRDSILRQYRNSADIRGKYRSGRAKLKAAQISVQNTENISTPVSSDSSSSDSELLKQKEGEMLTPTNTSSTSDIDNTIGNTIDNPVWNQLTSIASNVQQSMSQSESNNAPQAPDFSHIFSADNSQYTQKRRGWNSTSNINLIKKANERYGTSFRNMEDVAAFQKEAGAKKVDGLIGPETEAYLRFYFPEYRNSNNDLQLVNTRRMYRNQTNDQVYSNTANQINESFDDNYWKYFLSQR